MKLNQKQIANWLKTNYKAIVITIYLGLILFINITKSRFEIDFIILTVFLIALLWGQGKKFIRDWVPFVFFFWLYEYTRELAHLFSIKFSTPLQIESLIKIEKTLFFFLDKIPTVIIQNALHPDFVTRWYDHILFFFYTSHFWIWALTGFVIWKYRRELFKSFAVGLLGFSFVCNILYAIMPTAPPWYASEIGILPPLERVMWSLDILPKDSTTLITLLYENPYAAFPSLHVGWSYFCALFLTKTFGKRAAWTFIFPTMIFFAVVYGAEHYIIDGIAGIIAATSAYYFVIKILKSKK